MSSIDLVAVLDAGLERVPAGPLVLGYSGGLDSSVLLHVASRSARARERGLRAVHVDHAIHADSAAWAAHCVACAARWDVEIEVVRATVARDAGLGLEGAAREARYAAFAAKLPERGVLLLAQHADDQAETVLQRLMRASGARGLSGMPALRAFAHGTLWRPFLALERRVLRDEAARHALAVLDDPSNADAKHDRNYVRARVLAPLRERWPDAARAIAQSADWLAGAQRAVDAQAAALVAQAATLDAAALRLDVLARADDFLLGAAIGHWLERLALPSPPLDVLRRVRSELVEARRDGRAMLAWGPVELRRFRDTVHAMRALRPVDRAWSARWDGAAPLALPDGLGCLALEVTRTTRPVGPFEVGFRHGGERIRLAANRPSRAVKQLLNALGVPPWLRERVPLLSDADGLVAIGDLAVAERLLASGARLRWSGASR